MHAAAFWRIALALTWAAPGVVSAAESPARTTPSRPTDAAAPAIPAARSSSGGPVLPIKKFGAVEYVRAADVAARLGLKFTTSARGRQATLSGPSARAELENDSREVTVNGLRVFLGNPVLDAQGQLYVSRIDYERCLTPLLKPGYGVAALQKPKLVVLDPGHGGRDNGTSIQEKVFALEVAQRAKKMLEAAGFKVVLTREKDVFVDLVQRPAIANREGADLFVSIHFNAVPRDSKTSGVEIYTFPPQSQRSTKSWSPGESNDAEHEAVPGNRYDHWNVVLAQSIHRRFVSDLKTFDRGKKLYHLGVLRSLKCPGVLLECGFLTSSIEAKKIATPEYRQKLAEALAAGIRDYAATFAGASAAGANGAAVAGSRTAPPG